MTTTKTMKEQILKYIKLSPNMLYYDLVKIFGLSIEDLLELLDINNYKIDKFNNLRFYDNSGNRIYKEYSIGSWYKYEYDNNGNVIKEEHSNGFWYKLKYDDNGNEIYYEQSNGFWKKWEYDINGKQIYFENSDGEWTKWEYDKYGNEIYSEDSNGNKKTY